MKEKKQQQQQKNTKKTHKKTKNIQIFSPNKSILQTICYPLKTIDYPSRGLFTTPLLVIHNHLFRTCLWSTLLST